MLAINDLTINRERSIARRIPATRICARLQIARDNNGKLETLQQAPFTLRTHTECTRRNVEEKMIRYFEISNFSISISNFKLKR